MPKLTAEDKKLIKEYRAINAWVTKKNIEIKALEDEVLSLPAVRLQTTQAYNYPNREHLIGEYTSEVQNPTREAKRLQLVKLIEDFQKERARLSKNQEPRNSTVYNELIKKGFTDDEIEKSLDAYDDIRSLEKDAEFDSIKKKNEILLRFLELSKDVHNNEVSASDIVAREFNISPSHALKIYFDFINYPIKTPSQQHPREVFDRFFTFGRTQDENAVRDLIASVDSQLAQLAAEKKLTPEKRYEMQSSLHSLVRKVGAIPSFNNYQTLYNDFENSLKEEIQRSIKAEEDAVKKKLADEKELSDLRGDPNYAKIPFSVRMSNDPAKIKAELEKYKPLLTAEETKQVEEHLENALNIARFNPNRPEVVEYLPKLTSFLKKRLDQRPNAKDVDYVTKILNKIKDPKTLVTFDEQEKKKEREKEEAHRNKIINDFHKDYKSQGIPTSVFIGETSKLEKWIKDKRVELEKNKQQIADFKKANPDVYVSEYLYHDPAEKITQTLAADKKKHEEEVRKKAEEKAKKEAEEKRVAEEKRKTEQKAKSAQSIFDKMTAKEKDRLKEGFGNVKAESERVAKKIAEEKKANKATAANSLNSIFDRLAGKEVEKQRDGYKSLKDERTEQRAGERYEKAALAEELGQYYPEIPLNELMEQSVEELKDGIEESKKRSEKLVNDIQLFRQDTPQPLTREEQLKYKNLHLRSIPELEQMESEALNDWSVRDTARKKAESTRSIFDMITGKQDQSEKYRAAEALSNIFDKSEGVRKDEQTKEGLSILDKLANKKQAEFKHDAAKEVIDAFDVAPSQQMQPFALERALTDLLQADQPIAHGAFHDEQVNSLGNFNTMEVPTLDDPDDIDERMEGMPAMQEEMHRLIEEEEAEKANVLALAEIAELEREEERAKIAQEALDREETQAHLDAWEENNKLEKEALEKEALEKEATEATQKSVLKQLAQEAQKRVGEKKAEARYKQNYADYIAREKKYQEFNDKINEYLTKAAQERVEEKIAREQQRKEPEKVIRELSPGDKQYIKHKVEDASSLRKNEYWGNLTRAKDYLFPSGAKLMKLYNEGLDSINEEADKQLINEINAEAQAKAKEKQDYWKADYDRSSKTENITNEIMGYLNSDLAKIERDTTNDINGVKNFLENNKINPAAILKEVGKDLSAAEKDILPTGNVILEMALKGYTEDEIKNHIAENIRREKIAQPLDYESFIKEVQMPEKENLSSENLPPILNNISNPQEAMNAQQQLDAASRRAQGREENIVYVQSDQHPKKRIKIGIRADGAPGVGEFLVEDKRNLNGNIWEPINNPVVNLSGAYHNLPTDPEHQLPSEHDTTRQIDSFISKYFNTRSNNKAEESLISQKLEYLRKKEKELQPAEFQALLKEEIKEKNREKHADKIFDKMNREIKRLPEHIRKNLPYDEFHMHRNPKGNFIVYKPQLDALDDVIQKELSLMGKPEVANELRIRAENAKNRKQIEKEQQRMQFVKSDAWRPLLKDSMLYPSKEKEKLRDEYKNEINETITNILNDTIEPNPLVAIDDSLAYTNVAPKGYKYREAFSDPTSHESESYEKELYKKGLEDVSSKIKDLYSNIDLSDADLIEEILAQEKESARLKPKIDKDAIDQLNEDAIDQLNDIRAEQSKRFAAQKPLYQGEAEKEQGAQYNGEWLPSPSPEEEQKQIALWKKKADSEKLRATLPPWVNQYQAEKILKKKEDEKKRAEDFNWYKDEVENLIKRSLEQEVKPGERQKKLGYLPELPKSLKMSDPDVQALNDSFQHKTYAIEMNHLHQMQQDPDYQARFEKQHQPKYYDLHNEPNLYWEHQKEHYPNNYAQHLRVLEEQERNNRIRKDMEPLIPLSKHFRANPQQAEKDAERIFNLNKPNQDNYQNNLKALTKQNYQALQGKMVQQKQSDQRMRDEKSYRLRYDHLDKENYKLKKRMKKLEEENMMGRRKRIQLPDYFGDNVFGFDSFN